jgi:hypothetical protein
VQGLDEIAKRFNARIDRFRGLNVATIPVQCRQKADIGFSRNDRKLMARVFPFLARRKVRAGLYVYGKDVDRWAELFAVDDVLCTALSDLLDGYAYCIEWAGQSLSARVNAMFATIDGDETGGERFFGKLAAAAGRLSALADQHPVAVSPSARSCGPVTGRRLALVASFVVPFALLFLFRHFTTHLAH